MAPLTIETEVSPEGTVQVRVPDAPAGRRVKVTVEDVGLSDPVGSPGEAQESELDVRLAELKRDYEARRITQPEFSAAYVELLERYDAKGPHALSKPRVLGRWKGMIHIMPGFDDPIEGLEWAYE